MREAYQNILFAIVLVFLIALAILLYKQQKTIDQLSNVSKVPLENANIAQIDRDQKNSEAKIKFIEGKLISVSGNVLVVEAQMPDWQKMKEPRDASKTDLTIKKIFTVTVSDKTQYLANKLDGIKAGDTVEVASNELVYQTDKLTAALVVSPSALPAP
jgi:hypothetical protein